MDDPTELVTVFRSAETNADEEAEQVCDLLVEAGLTAISVDDSVPGVVEGSWEVRVPASQAEQADRVMAEEAAAAPAADPGEDLDLVPLFEEGTDISELEAMNLKALLEANDIPAFIIGAPQMPNLPFDVRVPRERFQDAHDLIAASVADPGPGGESAPAEADDAAK
jgi:hypothetical protein